MERTSLRLISLAVIFLMMTVAFAGCSRESVEVGTPEEKNPRGREASTEDKQEAQKIANAGELVVSYTSNVSPYSNEPKIASGENVDLQVFLSKPGGKEHEFYVGLNRDHTQYAAFKLLRKGDGIKLQYVDTPQQEWRNPATHLKIIR